MRPLSLLLCSLALTAAAPAQQGSIAVRVGKAFLPDGSVVQDATLVVRDGRVAAFGPAADVEVPFDVVLHEHPDAVLWTGFYEAHTSNGMDRPNENVPIAPFLDVKDSIDPVSFFFEDSLRRGTVAMAVIPGNDTVIGGRGRVVAPHGMTVEDMTLEADAGVKIAIGPKRGWSRSAQLAELREAELELARDLKEIGARLLHESETRADRGDEPDEDRAPGGFVRFGDDFPGKELITEDDLDDTQRGLVRILNGDERLWVWAPQATDLVHARRWLEDRGLLGNSTFVVTSAAHEAADQLAEMGRPVVLLGDPWHVVRDPVTREEVRTFAPKVFHEAGVTFALTPDRSRLGPDRLAYQAALAIREGVPAPVALAAVTTVPAAMWGLEDRLASFAEGADGTFVLLDAEPLDPVSHVLEVWVQGEKVYDRNTDERLQRLLEGRRN